ncbi:hypothetical protein B0T17DRAFT_155595 [Bombardia bombarda]|uniref:Uncharacterized protein n=1 Tax=Bombardia bombarda TaxID=252184 RepID=A0AA39X725_9PEZI|nr:hypothetical protein B0T17DRAFT_155595 [Bombardia bombarda]
MGLTFWSSDYLGPISLIFLFNPPAWQLAILLLSRIRQCAQWSADQRGVYGVAWYFLVLQGTEPRWVWLVGQEDRKDSREGAGVTGTAVAPVVLQTYRGFCFWIVFVYRSFPFVAFLLFSI